MKEINIIDSRNKQHTIALANLKLALDNGANFLPQDLNKQIKVNDSKNKTHKIRLQNLKLALDNGAEIAELSPDSWEGTKDIGRHLATGFAGGVDDTVELLAKPMDWVSSGIDKVFGLESKPSKPDRTISNFVSQAVEPDYIPGVPTENMEMARSFATGAGSVASAIVDPFTYLTGGVGRLVLKGGAKVASKVATATSKATSKGAKVGSTIERPWVNRLNAFMNESTRESLKKGAMSMVPLTPTGLAKDLTLGGTVQVVADQYDKINPDASFAEKITRDMLTIMFANKAINVGSSASKVAKNIALDGMNGVQDLWYAPYKAIAKRGNTTINKEYIKQAKAFDIPLTTKDIYKNNAPVNFLNNYSKQILNSIDTADLINTKSIQEIEKSINTNYGQNLTSDKLSQLSDEIRQSITNQLGEVTENVKNAYDVADIAKSKELKAVFDKTDLERLENVIKQYKPPGTTTDYTFEKSVKHLKNVIKDLSPRKLGSVNVEQPKTAQAIYTTIKQLKHTFDHAKISNAQGMIKGFQEELRNIASEKFPNAHISERGADKLHELTKIPLTVGLATSLIDKQGSAYLIDQLKNVDSRNKLFAVLDQTKNGNQYKKMLQRVAIQDQVLSKIVHNNTFKGSEFIRMFENATPSKDSELYDLLGNKVFFHLQNNLLPFTKAIENTFNTLQQNGTQLLSSNTKRVLNAAGFSIVAGASMTNPITAIPAAVFGYILPKYLESASKNPRVIDDLIKAAQTGNNKTLLNTFTKSIQVSPLVATERLMQNSKEEQERKY